MTGVAIRQRDERISAELRGEIPPTPTPISDGLRSMTCLTCGAEFQIASCWSAVRCGVCGTDHLVGES